MLRAYSFLLVSSTALVLSMPSHADPLDINPFPMKEAESVSAQEPDILTPAPVEVFAKEAETEIIEVRLEAEPEVLPEPEQMLLEQPKDMFISDVEAIEPSASNDFESALERRYQETEQLHFELKDEKARLQEQEFELRKRKARLEREKAEFRAVRQQELEAQKRRALVIKAESDRVARERAEIEGFRQGGVKPAFSPDFDSHAMKKQKSVAEVVRDTKMEKGNPVGMTPMPDVTGQESSDQVIEVELSDLDLDAENVSETSSNKAAPKRTQDPVMTRQMQLAKQGLTVIPVRGAGELQAFNSSRSVQPTLIQDARSGNSLEDVLRSWSQQARIGFLWKTTQRYAVKDDVSMANGKYAETVQALLDQYKDDKVRPVGRLHVDPVTGNKTLTIVTQ